MLREIKMENAQDIIKLFRESADVKMAFAENEIAKMSWLVDILQKVFQMKNKLLLFGNGGSAADASHIAGEFVNRFKINRVGLRAISLGTDISVLTSIANDFSYAEIFSKQLEALVDENDMVFAFSTSGNSENVVKGVETAKKMGAFTVAFTGQHGGRIAKSADITFCVPSNNTPRIQECHMTLCHVICELVEKNLFEKYNNHVAGMKHGEKYV